MAFRATNLDGRLGTYFKKDGVFENRAERSRVEELMSEAKKFRDQPV
jgi:predicted TIM-barrel enzyme